VIIVIKTEIANHGHHDQPGEGREQSAHHENTPSHYVNITVFRMMNADSSAYIILSIRSHVFITYNL
jgi:hypothetical protein